MDYRHIRLEKGSPHVGAEILGVDLSRSLAPEVVREIRWALADNGVVGFRDQTLSVEQQIAFGKQSASCTSIRSPT